jgi:hypothetical protein
LVTLSRFGHSDIEAEEGDGEWQCSRHSFHSSTVQQLRMESNFFGN